MCTKTWNLVLQKYRCVHSRAAFCHTAMFSEVRSCPWDFLTVLRRWSTRRIPPAPSSDNQTVTRKVVLGPFMGLCLQWPLALKSSTIEPEIPSSGERYLPSVEENNVQYLLLVAQEPGTRHSYRKKNWTKASCPPSQTLRLWPDWWDLVQGLVPKESSLFFQERTYKC